MSDAYPERRPDGSEPDPTRSPYSRHGTPAPLAVAAGLTFVQGLLTFIFGVGEAINIDSDRVVMGLTTAAFFLAYGAALLACAWGMNNLRSWSRGPGADHPADLARSGVELPWR